MAKNIEWDNGKYVSTTGRVYDEAEAKKKAQQYAQDALEGKNGRYLSPSQTVEAVINAKVPIKETEIPLAVGSGGTDSAMNRYLNELNRQRAERQAMLDAQYKSGKDNINQSAEAGNKEAYTAYMQGIKNMPQKSAMYGSGGMAQSLATKSQLNYENNRNNIENARLSALADLENNYRNGVMESQDNYLAKLYDARAKAASGSEKATVAGYRLGDNKTVHTGTDEQALTGLVNELMSMGFTRQQAEEYIRRQM